MITFGSLFSGIGGFDLGFERAGMVCAWQVEFDKNCQNILRKHWSETELFDDVRTAGKHNLEPVDVICGGFPCQDVSIAGKRAGLAGERSGLWSEFARIIDELEPKWVVIENVPGLLSSNRGRDFATVVRWLAERGYGVAWRILDSQYFGVAQRRRRVFIVASFGDGRTADVLFESEGMRWDFEESENGGAGTSTAHTISTGDDKADGRTCLMPAENLAVGHSGGVTLKINNKVNALNGQSGSGTTAMFNGVITPTGMRSLTPTECELLHGFPRGWTEGQTDSCRYMQTGNAVTVNVAEWIAKRIILVHEGSNR